MPQSPSSPADPTPSDRAIDCAADGLSFTIGGRTVLDGVDLAVRQGEIFAIAAHGGAGKTTLFRLLLGLARPSSGRVTLLGENPLRVGTQARIALRKRVGAAYQDGALFDSLTVLENVMFPLAELADIDGATIEIVARMKLQQVDLLEFEQLRPSELSTAMVRRASIARAIALDPKLLICDDIFSGLDGRTQLSLIELLQMLRDAFSMTVVVLTSQLDVALALGTRVALLDSGRIVACGTPSEIRDSEAVHMFLAGEDPAALAGSHAVDRLVDGVR